MYAFQFPNGRFYVGGGPDALILGTAEVFPAIHTVFGGEYNLGRFGVFAETRAIIPLPLPAPFPALRVGANVYFALNYFALNEPAVTPAASAERPVAEATQVNYVGASVSVTDDFFGLKPLFGVQAGRLLAEQVTLRGGLETNLSDFALSADVLYAFSPPAELGGYAGGGVRYAYFIDRTIGVVESAFDVYGVLGLEYRPYEMGYFAEVQPRLALSLLGVKARAGVNIDF